MTRVLVDTSSWIEALRKKGDEGTRQRIGQLIREGRAVWCDLVMLELYAGARGSQEVSILRSYEVDLECLETNPRVWSLAREVGRRCRAAGINVPASDLLIAACANFHGVSIEHRDSDFELISPHLPVHR